MYLFVPGHTRARVHTCVTKIQVSAVCRVLKAFKRLSKGSAAGDRIRVVEHSCFSLVAVLLQSCCAFVACLVVEHFCTFVVHAMLRHFRRAIHTIRSTLMCTCCRATSSDKYSQKSALLSWNHSKMSSELFFENIFLRIEVISRVTDRPRFSKISLLIISLYKMTTELTLENISVRMKVLLCVMGRSRVFKVRLL